ncbi:unnamed protein product [Staurois parvus]|uniref:Uncharacterized protein n=1 Tax=Staurois parvus TaxID=386267 RepID=A0ABN9F5E8_9NEOB|nr:unnamed protein product [Staurois parvus]
MQHCTHMNFLSIFLRQIKLYFGGIYSQLGFYIFCYVNEKSKNLKKKCFSYNILQINNISS